MKNTSSLRFAALSSLAVLALAGCSAASPATGTTPSSAPAAQSFTVTNSWVKSANSGMSAAFGSLENTGDHDVTVSAVSTVASTHLELHETVANESGEMVMREKTDGFTIPAHGSLALEPGANHIMMMDLAEPLQAGEGVVFTVTFSDASTSEFTAPVKDYAGANESYEGSGDKEMDMDHSASESGHDH